MKNVLSLQKTRMSKAAFLLCLCCGIFAVLSDAHAQLEGVFQGIDVIVDEILVADKEVEEAAEEQAVQLGFIVPDDNFDQWLFNQNGIVDKGGTKTRERLHALARSRIEEISGLCSLNEGQKKKLELASRGDIVELFDRVEGVRTKFRQIKNDQNKFNQIWQDIQPLQVAFNSEQFGPGSFFHKSLRRVLTQDQFSDYEKTETERRRFQYRTAISAIVAQMELNVPFLDEQREQLIKLTLDETPLPKTFGQYTQQIVLVQMSAIPPKKLEAILDPIQMRIIDIQMQQVRGMKRWLIQQGIIDAESPRKNKDVDD